MHRSHKAAKVGSIPTTPINTPSYIKFMQKVINVLAVVSFAVSGAVVASGVYVYVNKDTIIDKVKAEALSSVGELLGTSQLGSTLLSGTGEDVDVTDAALGADSSLPIPTLPF